MVLPERNLHGHPLAGSLVGKDSLRKFYWSAWMAKVPNWECLFVHRKQGLFLSVPNTGWRFYRQSRDSRANLQAASSSSSTWDQTQWKTNNWNSQHSSSPSVAWERNLQPTDRGSVNSRSTMNTLGPGERSHCDDLRQSGGFTQTVTPTNLGQHRYCLEHFLAELLVVSAPLLATSASRAAPVRCASRQHRPCR